MFPIQHMIDRPRTMLHPCRRSISVEVVAAMLVTIGLQFSFALFMLMHGNPGPVQGEAQELRSVLTWVNRRYLSSPPVNMPPSAPPSPAHAKTESEVRAASTPQADAQPLGSTLSIDPPAPLILTVPSTTPVGTFNSHALDRSKSPPAYEQTRFAKTWTPDGGAVQKTWAHRSRAARLLLSATGALDFPCTDEEKRLRKPRCGGAQYDGPE